MTTVIESVKSVKGLVESLFSDAPVITQGKRSVGMPRAKYEKTDIGTYGKADDSIIGRAYRFMELFKEKGVKHMQKAKLRGYAAYRGPDTIYIDREQYKGKLDTLEQLAYAAAVDPKIGYLVLHEAYEDPYISHTEVQEGVKKKAMEMGYRESYELARKYERMFGWDIGQDWPTPHMDRLDEYLELGPTYKVRPTGQLEEIQPVVRGDRNIVIQSFAAKERVGIDRWQDADLDPVDGALSFLGTEMKATGYYISPISQLRPPGIVFTLGPRGPSHREKQLMQGMQEARESAYKRGYEAGKAAA